MEILFKISTFLFVFSLLGISKNTVKFLTAIFSNPPKKIEYTDKETILIGFFLSYIITYLIFL